MNEDYDGDGEPWELRRRPPGRPYSWDGAVLCAPRAALSISCEVFDSYARHEVEACCFWYGICDASGAATVSAVVVPQQRNTWGNFAVTKDGVRAMALRTRPLGLVNLAQLHTHPGPWVEHSRYDDANVNSRQALSLVLPNYGCMDDPNLDEIGVHAFQNDYWYLLTRQEAERRLVLLATGDVTLEDCR